MWCSLKLDHHRSLPIVLYYNMRFIGTVASKITNIEEIPRLHAGRLLITLLTLTSFNLKTNIITAKIDVVGFLCPLSLRH